MGIIPNPQGLVRIQRVGLGGGLKHTTQREEGLFFSTASQKNHKWASPSWRVTSTKKANYHAAEVAERPWLDWEVFWGSDWRKRKKKHRAHIVLNRRMRAERSAYSVSLKSEVSHHKGHFTGALNFKSTRLYLTCRHSAGALLCLPQVCAGEMFVA